jgi:succinyl-CoA synthetase beta subunit
MKIYEHQAKDLFRAYGITVPAGVVARTPDEAERAAGGLAPPFVVKAQIYAGGRGKAGGIRVVETAQQVRSAADALMGKRLVTPQTGAEGQMVASLLIEESVAVQRELYVGITIDRQARCPIVLASSEGGVEIEKLAAEAPDKIVRERIDAAFGLRPFQASAVAYGLGLNGRQAAACSAILLRLYRLFIEKDCANAEINPLVVTGAGDLVALDAKVNIDDNALFRHADLAALHDTGQDNSLETEASRLGLNYIKLKGNVGCMVNGAGLAMATMDLIKHVGAEPANFLDVGGGATAAMIREGLRIILSDTDVRLLFVNIFGGILRCDTLAQGLTEGARELHIGIPVIIRLEGTNREIGEKLLLSSGLNFIPVSGMGEASHKIAELLSIT